MSKKHAARSPGRIKSSIVARLNTRLFFRLLGIYFCMDLLLTLLFTGGMFLWAERQCVEISALVDQRGVPSADATEWMQAGDYIVTAGDYAGGGWALPSFFPAPEETAEGTRYFDPGTPASSSASSASTAAGPPATRSPCPGRRPTPSPWT